MLWLLVPLAVALPSTSGRADEAFFWNVTDAAISYEEQVAAFAAQGLMNRASGPLLFFAVGLEDYDWPQAEPFWRRTLEKQGRVRFTTLPSSFCSVITTSKSVLDGLVVYSDSGRTLFGDGYSIAIALTIAAQRSLLPVSSSMLAKHGCLSSMAVKHDLRRTLLGKTRQQAWDWAIRSLLPSSSKAVVFNLNKYRVAGDPVAFLHDKQSNATALSIDYVVQQNAFVMDLESHDSAAGNRWTRPWNGDDELIERVFAALEPLFDAYGWADDEFSWTNETSHFGGTVMCSFASPNLSFWAKLKLPGEAARARKLPTHDRGVQLARSKYYVTFETNEGDTPRILVSAMAHAWASPKRGSLPIAWAIDPLLARRFPALFDFYAATASVNDSFIAGTAGAGYAYLNQMSASQLDTYGRRVGELTSTYGPSVIDTYGYANVSTHDAYAKAIAAGGGLPAAFISQPNWEFNFTWDYLPFRCGMDSGDNLLLDDGRTPLICASGSPALFYPELSDQCPSCDLAGRIKAVAAKHKPPFFIVVYGNLQAFGGSVCIGHTG